MVEDIPEEGLMLIGIFDLKVQTKKTGDSKDMLVLLDFWFYFHLLPGFSVSLLLDWLHLVSLSQFTVMTQESSA